jgi:hypothetical protein
MVPSKNSTVFLLLESEPKNSIKFYQAEKSHQKVVNSIIIHNWRQA